MIHSAAAQSPFNGSCQVSSSPLQVHAEGLAERMGDLVLRCSGANPGSVLGGNLTVYLPIPVTNRIDQNNQTHDTVLSVDTGSGFAPTALAALVSPNSVSFNGLSLAAPTGSINLKVSGIRGAVSQLGLISPQPVVASVSFSIPLAQAQTVVAYPQLSLTATLYDTGITCYGSPSPATLTMSNLFAAGTAFASTRLTEGYASAFEVRSTGADTGTRFLIKYNGFPANAHLYLPDAVAGSDAAVPTAGGDLGVAQAVGQYVPGSNTLVLVRVPSADVTGAGGFAVSAPQGSGPVSLNSVTEVPLTNGSGYAVYEVADSNPSVQESAQFPTFIAVGNVNTPSIAQETVALAPQSTVATASATAPIPRFIAAHVPSDCTSIGDCNASYFPKLMVDTTPLSISAIANGGIMTSAPAYIPIRNGAGGLMEWSVTINYQTGSGWLFVDYSSGLNNGSVRVWSDTKTLGPGTYQASVSINAGSAGSQSIPLTLTVAAAAPPPPQPPPVTTPSVTVSQVVNAATFTTTPLVAGSLATVMGSHFTGKSVSVTFDGTAAAVLFSNDTQINLQVPASLGSKTTANLVVTVDGVSSAPAATTLAPAWPSVFANGVLNQNNSLNGASAPAKAGDILQIFATGIPDGALVSAQIGDQGNLVPLYAGVAPTVPGVQQVNVAVPAGTTAGASLKLCATVAGQQYCSSGTTLSVQ
jgi:uncharacterized protein (TIGR03437 family)